MIFVQREYDKLMTLCQNTPPGPAYDALYLAKGALAWALDPDAFMSPSGQVAKFYGVETEPTKWTGVHFTGKPDGDPAPVQ